MIYFDNAATTIDKDKKVIEAITYALMNKNFANPSRGSYKLSQNALRKLIEIRMSLANFFESNDPKKVILTPNITYSLNIIIKSLFKKGDHVISSLAEHNSVLRPLYDFETRGGELSFIGIDDKFNLELDQIEKLIKENTKALVITAASNVSGKVTDLKKVYSICKKHKLKLIIDGAQLAGACDFSMEDFDDTIFAFTGHKALHGPQGTGGFIIKGDFDFEQVFSGGSGFDSFSKKQPHSLPDLFEPGTANLPSFIGLEAAIEVLKENKPYEKLDKLTRYLYENLKENKNLDFYTRLEKINAPIVSFNIKGFDANTISHILDLKYDICTRAGSHCAPLFHKRFGTKKRSIVRLSLSPYNTKEEIDYVVKAINEISIQK
ncbi:MAG: aminotransferase class V-fold PLP-dependent enzyme [Peptoniphilaceae bacterium]|nr:aminotransferase class V-fold PLP-dependent enzyme [Peptoniphilaceae bacterium]MDY6018745.1 aminotransferase class V-fold PLP-dependent enzyme [Anaerococcus sp.]